ncbi:MAG: hypothetical protein JOZ57_11720, partial [Abitibacteriaceae bacterium]|nr:hypothetical protein [Abditibacteriaceae bacterium]
MIQHIYHDKAWREFHVARTSRDRYQFDQTLFATDGNVILADFQAARLFAQRMNEKRDLTSFPEQAVQASHINAMGMIDEILHYVIARYREEENPQVLGKALAWLEERLGVAAVDAMLQQFVDEFPPITVYCGEQDSKTYLGAETGGVP